MLLKLGFKKVAKKKSHFKVLKENKVPLTEEERTRAHARKAVWHMSNRDKPTSAVWKSRNRNGTFTYVTNTHRAFNTAPTLDGAISRYHKFIKSTA